MSLNKTKLAKSIQNRGNYSVVPNELWQLDLSVHAKIVYIYLISQADTWTPGTRMIAEGTGISRPTLAKALLELQKSRMIEIDDGPRGLRDVYVILGVDDWILAPLQGGKNIDQPENEEDVGGKNIDQGVVKILTSGGKNIDHIQEEDKKKPRRGENGQTGPSTSKDGNNGVQRAGDQRETNQRGHSLHPEEVQSSQASVRAIVLSWKSQYGKGLECAHGKSTDVSIPQLIQTLQDNQHSAVRGKVVADLVFGPNPRGKIPEWRDQFMAKFEDAWTLATEKVDLSDVPVEEELMVGGMSHAEHLLQQKIASQYKTLDTTELEEIYKAKQQQ